MLSHYVQLQARLYGSMRALLHAYLVGLSLRLHALPLCALGHNNGSNVCVQAANALMRLCICPGSSELSMLLILTKKFSLVGMCLK